MIRFMKKVDRFQYISFITFKFNIAIGLKYLLDFDLFIPNVSCGNMKIQSSKEKKKKKKKIPKTTRIFPYSIKQLIWSAIDLKFTHFIENRFKDLIATNVKKSITMYITTLRYQNRLQTLRHPLNQLLKKILVYSLPDSLNCLKYCFP